MKYKRSAKYTDLEAVYAHCSGPGGLKLAEFIGDKLALRPGQLILDVGIHYGLQTCFLAKEYGVFAVGIDPVLPNIGHLVQNAQSWDVQDRVLAVQVGVPDTKFADNSFDAACSTTTFEMIRGFSGEDKCRECLAEVYRVLRPGGLFGYGDPMHLDVEIPSELVPLVTEGEGSWADSFPTLQETVEAFGSVGFEIMEADYSADAQLWWEEYCQYDPGCRASPDKEPQAIRVDGGRWLSYGYVIAKKPV